MEDRIYRTLNGKQILRDRIDDFKEAFIEFYGEENRDFVEKQFSKVILIGYLSPEDEKRIVNSAIKDKNKEIFNRIIEESILN